MPSYTVRQLANMAGVTVRTLHHYDQIGLLRPPLRSSAGYRLYDKDDLLRLQQILFYRELDFALQDIQDVLDDPAFDQVAALRDHRSRLLARAKRLNTLIDTIDRTIIELTEENMTLSDKDLYEGFDKETAARYQREARERYDPQLVQESERRIKKMSKQEWTDTKAEGGEIARLLAECMTAGPDDAQVQALIAKHHAWIERFYPASAEVYTGLAQLYVENDEFRAFYDRFAPGLADFMRAAMTHYAEHSL